MSCVWPSVRSRLIEKLVHEYQQAATRLELPGTWRRGLAGRGGGPGIVCRAGGCECGVAGQARRAADDIVSLTTVSTDPVALCGRVFLLKRRGSSHRVKEDGIDEGVGTGQLGDCDHHISRDLPLQIDPADEIGEGFGVEYRSGGGIRDLNLFRGASSS